MNEKKEQKMPIGSEIQRHFNFKVQTPKILILTCLSLGNSGVGNDDWGDSRGLGDGFQVNQTDTTASNDSDLHSAGLFFHNSHGQGRLLADALSMLEGEGNALLAECAKGNGCDKDLHDFR